MEKNKNMELKVVTKLSSPAEIKKHLGQKGYFFHCLEDLKNGLDLTKDLTKLPFVFGTFIRYEYGSYLPIVAHAVNIPNDLYFFGFIPESEIQRLVDSRNVEEPENEKDYKKLYERYFHLCRVLEESRDLWRDIAEDQRKMIDDFLQRHPEMENELNLIS